MTFTIFRIHNRAGYKLTITLRELQKALGDDVMKFENILGEKIQLVGYFEMGKMIYKIIGKTKILQLIGDYDFINTRFGPYSYYIMNSNDVDLWKTDINPKELTLDLFRWGNKEIRLDADYKIKLLDVMVNLGADIYPLKAL